eukprot:g3291.t1
MLLATATGPSLGKRLADTIIRQQSGDAGKYPLTSRAEEAAMVKAAPVLTVSNDVEERLREQEERRRKWAQERPEAVPVAGSLPARCGFGPLDYKIVSATSYSSGRSTENLQSWSRESHWLGSRTGGDRILIQLPRGSLVAYIEIDNMSISSVDVDVAMSNTKRRYVNLRKDHRVPHGRRCNVRLNYIPCHFMRLTCHGATRTTARGAYSMRIMGMVGSDMEANIGPEMHNLLVSSTEEVLFPSADAADLDLFSRAPSTLPMDSESDVSQKMHMLDVTDDLEHGLDSTQLLSSILDMKRSEGNAKRRRRRVRRSRRKRGGGVTQSTKKLLYLKIYREGRFESVLHPFVDGTERDGDHPDASLAKDYSPENSSKKGGTFVFSFSPSPSSSPSSASASNTEFSFGAAGGSKDAADGGSSGGFTFGGSATGFGTATTPAKFSFDGTNTSDLKPAEAKSASADAKESSTSVEFTFGQTATPTAVDGGSAAEFSFQAVPTAPKSTQINAEAAAAAAAVSSSGCTVGASSSSCDTLAKEQERMFAEGSGSSPSSGTGAGASDSSGLLTKVQQAAADEQAMLQEHAAQTAGRPVCRFFLRGECLKSFACTFSHDLSSSGGAQERKAPSNASGDSSETAGSGAAEEVEKKRKAHARRTAAAPLCRFHVKGMCTRGFECRFSHSMASDGASATSSESGSGKKADDDLKEEAKCCGICFEELRQSGGPKVGLMENCDHHFCYACITKWRGQTQGNSEITKETQRNCPLCRKNSFFVVPSARPLVGSDRVAAIESFKQYCSTKPCRNWIPNAHRSNDSRALNRSCKLGHRCFYAHLRADGSDAKPAQKVAWDSYVERQKSRSARQRSMRLPFFLDGSMDPLEMFSLLMALNVSDYSDSDNEFGSDYSYMDSDDDDY